jgi:hypothetical protein
MTAQSSEADYRVYCHDRAIRVVTAEWVDAASDEEAVAAVEALYPTLVCEIWQGNRLVAKLDSDRALDSTPDQGQPAYGQVSPRL